MQFHDLSDSGAFSAACSALQELVERDYTPDLVIGIATGGKWVVEAMAIRPAQHVLFCKRQRLTTKAKSAIRLGKLVGHLPTSINNLLRIVELHAREVLFTLRGRLVESGNVTFSDRQGQGRAAIKSSERILIVDDTIDSGGTFRDVIRIVAESNPRAIVRTAALNQTFRHPVVECDYVLFRRAIVRGPWAMDAKPSRVMQSPVDDLKRRKS